MSNRENFSSTFGIIAAAAGSAVGLGNIWRFPYVAGENGGVRRSLKFVYIFMYYNKRGCLTSLDSLFPIS